MTKCLVRCALIVLLLCSESSSQKEPALSFPVTLNHFYVTVDPETYSAIENNDFLKNKFAAFERRTTVRTDMTYSGMYFYGRGTYFEFFAAGKQSEFKLGDSGIAFGVEQPDAVKKLETVLGSAQSKLVTRGLGDKQLPWFYMLELKLFPPHSALTSWIMEYHPEFLKLWNPSAKGNEGILRADVLTRYRNVLSSKPKQPILEDVVGLTIATDEESIARLKETCIKFGYRVSTEGPEVVLRGPDITLHLMKETSSERGIRQIDFRVQKTNEQLKPIHLGSRSMLQFKNEHTAIWTF